MHEGSAHVSGGALNSCALRFNTLSEHNHLPLESTTVCSSRQKGHSLLDSGISTRTSSLSLGQQQDLGKALLLRVKQSCTPSKADSLSTAAAALRTRALTTVVTEGGKPAEQAGHIHGITVTIPLPSDYFGGQELMHACHMMQGQPAANRN